jgi:outer membrane receptor protein involved in Fe transport
MLGAHILITLKTTTQQPLASNLPMLTRVTAGLRTRLRLPLSIAAVCIALCLACLADTLITGTVRDRSNAPVAGAQVTARSGQRAASAVTDSDGRFSIAAAFTTATLTVQATGFAPVEQQWVPSSGELSITLPVQSRSDTVSVTATRIESPLRDTPSTVIIDRDAIQNSGALALDDTLRQVPGFTLFRRSGSINSNPTTQGVSLRGVGASGASRALVMNDGLPLNDPFGGWIYWARVPRASVTSIDVVRGGVSDLYGSDAIGGVINVHNAHPTESSLSLETSIANRTTPFGSAVGSLRKGDWVGTLAGEGFSTDGYVPVPLEERGAVDFFATSEHRTADANLERLFGRAGRAFIRGTYYGESRDNGKIDEKNSANIRQLSTGVDWQSDLGNFGVRLFGGTEGLRQNFFAVADDRSSEHITRDQFVPVQQIGLSGQWSRTAGTRQTLLAGIDSRWVEGESAELAFTAGPSATSFLRNGGRQQTVGIFGEDIVRLTSRMLVTLSGRVDRWNNADGFSSTQPLIAGGTPASTQFQDRDEVAFSPRVSTVIRASERVTLHATVYRSFRAPTLNELYRSFRVGSVLTLANPLLTAEHLTGGETGVGLRLSERVNLRSTFFWNVIDGPVANVTQSVTPQLITRQRGNLGSTGSRGIEIETEARLTSSFMVSGGYQFADATVLEANGPSQDKLLPQVPRHEFTFQALYATAKFPTIALQGRYQSEQFDDDLNLLRLEPFFTMDAFVSKHLNPRLEIFAGGENLLNNRYTIGRTPVRTVAPPALVRVGMRIQLASR